MERTSAAGVGTCELRLPQHTGYTTSSTMRSEERDPRLEDLSAQPWVAYFGKNRSHLILPSPPILLTLCTVRNVRGAECPARHLTAPSTLRIFTLPSLPIFSVEAAGTVKFTSNRRADAIGALDECSAKPHEKRYISRHPVPDPGIARQCIFSVLAIEDSQGQQWLIPETQLTRTRIGMPNRRPPDPLRWVVFGPDQYPIIILRCWEAVDVYAR